MVPPLPRTTSASTTSTTRERGSTISIDECYKDKGKGLSSNLLSKRQNEKYAKMKMDLPEGAIRHKMMQDGISNEGIESFFNQVSGETINDGKNAKKIENPKLTKYIKMKKMGLPDGAIRHKMMQDGISDDLMNEFFNSGNTIMKSKPVKKEPKEEKLPPLDEKIVGKYRKMKKMGLPDGAIQHKMVQDGIDQAIINQFFNIKTAKNKSKIDINNPIFDPYKKMKKAGLPPPVIKHKMTMMAAHRKNPSVLW